MTNNTETSTETESSTSLVILAGIALAAIFTALWVFSIYNGKFINPAPFDREDWGQIGDFFGGILNPIFGFFGLMALLYTIHIQSRELKFSVREMNRSADAFEAQIEHLKFESQKNEAIRFIDIVFEKLMAKIDGEMNIGKDVVIGYFYDKVPIKAFIGTEKDKNVAECFSSFNDEKNDQIKFQLVYIAGHIKDLCEYLDNYEQILEIEGVVEYDKYSFFYKRTIYPYASDLRSKGYLDDEIMDFIIREIPSRFS